MNTLYCVDCKHHDKLPGIDRHACLRRSSEISMVTGKLKRVEVDCDSQRSSPANSLTCGPDAQFFEQKDRGQP